MKGVSELVQEGVVVALAAVRSQHEVHFLRHADWRAKRPRALSLALADVEDDASLRAWIDAHLRHLASHHRLHFVSGKGVVVLRRPEQHESVCSLCLGRLDSQRFPQHGWQRVVPHGFRIAQKLLAARREGLERNAGYRLERGVVVAGDVQRLDVFFLALQSLQAHWRVLFLHQVCSRLVERESERAIAGVRDFDWRRLVLDHSPVRRANDSGILPRDLALVERFLAERAGVLLVDRLQLRRLLETGVSEVALARDRFHERLAFSSQALKVERAHVASLRARKSLSWPASTRSCLSVSRSRTVTVPFVIYSPSTVIPNGVPISSCR